VNKRQSNRYRLAVTVNFFWEEHDHQRSAGQGQTRNCSVTGAFIVSHDQPALGSILQLEFTLPPSLAAGPRTQLRTQGCVVRTEPDGFAVLNKMTRGLRRPRETGH
jgi:hypothetical protein